MSEIEWRARAVELEGDKRKLLERVMELEQSLAKKCDKCEFCNSCNVDIERDSLIGRVKELESYPNNVVACVGCKSRVEVTALNAIRCKKCAADEVWKAKLSKGKVEKSEEEM